MPRSPARRRPFQCDCRGVGADWEVDEVRRIATALLGTVDLIAEPEQMASRLRADRCARRWAAASPSATLRVWAPQGAAGALRRARSRRRSRTSPARRQDVNALTGAYPTGAWGDESRDYHVAVRLPAKAVGQEQLAARVQLAVGDAGRRPGSGQGAVVRRRHADDAHRPGGRALHRPGRAGRRRSRTASPPRRPGDDDDGDGQARPGGPARRARPATRRRRPGCARSSTSTTPTPARCGCKRERRQARRDGARHGLDQDDPGEEVSAAPPGRAHATGSRR